MSIIDTLVTDRTQADVDARNEKGTYNAADLNRVGEAMAYLAGKYRAFGYRLSVSSPTDWTQDDIPTRSDLETYLDDLRTLRSAVAMLPDTPAPPEQMDGLTYGGANDIERLLQDIDALLESMGRSFLRAGMPWAAAGTQIYARNEG